MEISLKWCMEKPLQKALKKLEFFLKDWTLRKSIIFWMNSSKNFYRTLGEALGRHPWRKTEKKHKKNSLNNFQRKLGRSFLKNSYRMIERFIWEIPRVILGGIPRRIPGEDVEQNPDEILKGIPDRVSGGMLWRFAGAISRRIWRIVGQIPTGIFKRTVREHLLNQSLDEYLE